MKQVRIGQRAGMGSGRNVASQKKSARAARRISQAASLSAPHFESLERRDYLSVSQDANGWTVVTPSADSRIIYVSSSGGNDNNTGLSPAAPLQTITKGLTLLRPGYPDELLLKRGDTFINNISFSNYGRSVQEPMLMSNYGDPTLPRPVVDGQMYSAFHGGYMVQYFDLIGIDFTSSTHDPTSANFTNQGSYGIFDLGTVDNWLIEDCRFRNFSLGISIQANGTVPSGNGGPVSNVTIRRCEVLDCYTTNGNAQGVYVQGCNGLTIQDNIFDHDGWSEMVPGATANTFSHDVYLHSSNTNCVITNNVFANAASHGLQARGGGTVDNNLFLNNPAGFSFGLVNGSTTHPGGVSGEAIGNVVLGSANGANGGLGIELGNLMPGGNTVVANNLVANTPAGSDNPAFWMQPGLGVSNPQQEVGLNSLTLQNNIAYNWGWGMYISDEYIPGSVGADALSGVVIRNNTFGQMQDGRIVKQGVAYQPNYQGLSGNDYWLASGVSPSFGYAPPTASSGNPYAISFASWVAGVEPTAMNTPVQYVDPTRNVATYMATIGLTATQAAYLSAVRNMDKQHWDPRLLPLAVNPYILNGFTVDPSAPTASLAKPSDITSDTSPTQTITVTYNDNVAVDTSKIATGNIVVTGPGGFSQTATLVSVSGPNGPTVTATYQITAPNNTWTSVPSGTYVVSLVGGQVKDTSGNSIPAQNLGSFQVQLSAAPPINSKAPTQPATLTATPSSSAIILNFSDPANDQTGFLLQRADDSGFTTNVVNIPLTAAATTYTDATATVGKTYYYQLEAINAQGYSSPTPTVSAMILPSTPKSLGLIFDDGTPQRTPITSITLPFTQKVNVTTAMVSLTKRGTPATPIALAVANSTGDGKTWVLSFSGTGVNTGGILADGTYDLTVQYSKIVDSFGQAAGTDQTTTFAVDVAPIVTGKSLTNTAPPHTLSFTFSKDVSGTLSASTLVLTNTSTNTVVAASSFSWNASTLTGTWTFNNPLPDGNYTAKLPAANIADAAGVHLDGKANGIASSDNYYYSFTQTKPTITLSGASSVFQGTSYTLTLGTVSDIAQSVNQYIVRWGDSTTNTYTATGAVTHIFTGGGTPTISVDIVDSNGTHTNCGSLPLTVYRATMPLSGYSYSNIGSLYTLTLGAASDPGRTISSYVVRWGDGSSNTYTNTGNVTHTYTKANSNTTIAVDVVDDQGTSPNAGTLKLTVNAAPQVQLTGDLNTNVGGSYRLAISAAYDPGFNVSLYTVHWGDGTTSTYTTNGTVTHTYATVGSAQITVDVTDPTGTYTNTGKMTATVNPPPTIALSGNANDTVNDVYALTLGNVNDPGQAVTQYIVHWGDSTTSTYSNSGAVTHSYTSSGTKSITVDLVDGTGTYTNAGSLSVSVNPAQPLNLTGNNIYLKQDADGQNLDIWLNSATPGAGTPTQKVLNSSISSITLTGSAGNDAFTLDESAGVINPSGGIAVNGGMGANTLTLIGTAGANLVSMSAVQATIDGSTVNYQNVTGMGYTSGGGNDSLTLSAAPSLALDVNAGTVTVAANAGTGVRPVNFSAIQVAAGATVVFARNAIHANRSVIVVPLSGLFLSGLVDLSDNDLIGQGAGSAGLATIQSLVKAASNGEAWNGTNGLTSSAAKNAGNTALGFALNDGSKIGKFTTFDGIAVGSADVVVKYTYQADADLNGVVNGDDYFYIDYNYPMKSGATWVTGDFDYNGVTNGDDYFYVDANYLAGTGGANGPTL